MGESEVKKQIAAIDNEVFEKMTEITNLRQQIEFLEDDIQELEDEVVDLQCDKAELIADLESIDSKNCVIEGQISFDMN